MEVFTKANYRNEWNGRDKKGNELPTGTYYYVVTFENGTHKTGWVYLQRE
jgi:flagellar hook assembly protein FlgD